MATSVWSRYGCAIFVAGIFLIGSVAIIVGVALGVLANQIDQSHESVVQRVLEEYPLIDG